MNIGTEQVFIVNSTELGQLNQQTSTSLQRTFELPVAAAAMPSEGAPSSLCLTSAPLGPEVRSQMCRLCATVTELVVPIFHGEGLQNNLADKIHQHLPIQVSESDELPVVVCFQCTSTLLAWHELALCSVQADCAMRERFHLHRQQQQQPSVQSSQNQVKDEKSLPKVIKYILTQYVASINMDSEVKLVCQRCGVKTTLNDFTRHLITKHRSQLLDEDAVKTFVKKHVTFEEPLDSDEESDFLRDDSDVTDCSDSNSPKTKKKTKMSTLLCPYCNSAFSSTSRLVYHLGKHIEISLEDGVECCHTTYNTKKDFVSHLQEKHIDRSVQNTETMCKSCGFVADTPKQLQTHVEESHSRIEVKKRRKESAKNQKCIPAVCPTCNKTFSNKYNMFAHMKSHEDSLAYDCTKCGKKYSTKGNLRYHIRVIHEGDLKHVCNSCGEQFPTSIARDVHARLHTGDTPFRCQICNASFRAENSLARHLDMHFNVRKHACGICSKTFRKRSHLVAHGRTHRD